MREESDKANVARQYLLGTLPPEDASRLEETFFSDHLIFEEIEIAEDELVDAYVLQELSENERIRFEKNLGGLPRVAERIEFAKTLDRATRIASPRTDATGLDSATQSTSSDNLSQDVPAKQENIFSVARDERKYKVGWKGSFAAWLVPQRIGALVTAVVLLVPTSFLFFDWVRLRRETNQLVAEREGLKRELNAVTGKAEAEKRQLKQEAETVQAENETLAAEVDRLRPLVGAIEPVIALVLYPGGTRGEGRGSDLRLPSRPTTVNLQLALESDDYPQYGVVLKDANGSVIAQKRDLKSSTYKSTKIVTWRLPSKRFSKRAEYTVTLNGIRPPSDETFVTSYSFRTVAED